VTSTDHQANIERFYAALKGMNYLDKNELLNVVSAVFFPSERERQITLTYHRATMNVDTILKLPDGRHFQAIASLARTIFELAVEIRLMATVPDAAAKVKLFDDVEKLKSARRIVAFKNAHPDALVLTTSHTDFIAARATTIDADEAAMWPPKKAGKKPVVNHWTQLKLSERAECLGDPFHEIYELQYAQLSWYAHSGLTGVSGLSGETFAKLAGVALKIAVDAYMEIMHTVIDEFKIYKADPQIKARMQYAKLMPFTDGEQALDTIRRGLGL
jgi:hypothetical protein